MLIHSRGHVSRVFHGRVPGCLLAMCVRVAMCVSPVCADTFGGLHLSLSVADVDDDAEIARHAFLQALDANAGEGKHWSRNRSVSPPFLPASLLTSLYTP